MPKEDMKQKIRNIFQEYYKLEPIRKKIYSGYRDIVKSMKKGKINKEVSAKKIADYLRGIKDIPNQIRKIKK